MLLVNLESSYHFSVLEINLIITGWFLTNVTELDVIEFNAKGVVFSKLSIFLDKKLKIVNKGAFRIYQRSMMEIFKNIYFKNLAV